MFILYCEINWHNLQAFALFKQSHSIHTHGNTVCIRLRTFIAWKKKTRAKQMDFITFINECESICRGASISSREKAASIWNLYQLNGFRFFTFLGDRGVCVYCKHMTWWLMTYRVGVCFSAKGIKFYACLLYITHCMHISCVLWRDRNHLCMFSLWSYLSSTYFLLISIISFTEKSVRWCCFCVVTVCKKWQQQHKPYFQDFCLRNISHRKRCDKA